MPDLTEPDDRTGLYWPETDAEFAAILVRDDRAAAANDPAGDDPGAHWFAPNSEASPLTWDEIVRAGDQTPPLAAAIAFTIPERFATNGDTP